MEKFHKLTISEIKKETQNAVSILFDVPTELSSEFKYKAGQYITLKKNIADNEVRRAYSICTAPNSQQLRIVIKAVDNGTFSVFATTILKERDTLEVSKPEGKFILDTIKTNKNNYLAIAAGSGITPVMAMINTVLIEEPNSTFTLIYGNKSFEKTIFKTNIDTLQKQYPTKLNVQYVLSREQQNDTLFGRIDKGNINFIVKNKLKDISFTEAFLCGPEAMITTAKETLISNGFNQDNIHFELFTAPVSTENEANEIFEGTCEINVLVDDDESTFEMDSKTTILTATLKEGLDAPYSCQGGVCSSCMAKVTEGKAVMTKNVILSEDEINDGFILTCIAHPITKKITIDFDDV